MGATFWQDLDESNKKENELKKILEQQGYTVTTSQGKDVFSDYDLKVTNESGRSKTIELKYDKRSSTSNRIAVEVSKTISGKVEKSGITATNSDFIAYTFPADPNFYLIKTSELKKLVDNLEYEFTTYGGDNRAYKLALFNKEKFISNCTQIS